MKKIIDVRGLTKTFGKKGKFTAVNDISFSIQKGDIVAFIGPNGAGKSTTLKILTGILYPTNGNISVCGYTPWIDRTKLAYHIGCLFSQKNQLNMNIPVIDSYMLLGSIYDIEKCELTQRINELTTYFDVKDLIKKRAFELSLGQRMICEIIGAVLHKPEILFLDEPTIGLDINIKTKVRQLILKLNAQYGTTVILTSHDIGDIEALCQNIIIINHGKIVLKDSMKNMAANFLNKKIVTVTFDKEINLKFSNIINDLTILSINHQSCKLEIDTNSCPISDLIEKLSSFSRILSLDIKGTELEEIIKERFNS